jgi:hypothetical protein
MRSGQVAFAALPPKRSVCAPVVWLQTSSLSVMVPSTHFSRLVRDRTWYRLPNQQIKIGFFNGQRHVLTPLLDSGTSAAELWS